MVWMVAPGVLAVQVMALMVVAQLAMLAVAAGVAGGHEGIVAVRLASYASTKMFSPQRSQAE
jgi:hypothetical protein